MAVCYTDITAYHTNGEFAMVSIRKLLNPRIIAIANNKGGTGKTTTAVNLGAALAENHFSILEVDLDPQGNLSINLGVSIDQLSRTIYDVLLNPESYPLQKVIRTVRQNLDLAPANIDLSGATVELMDEISRESILKRALLNLKPALERSEGKDYDFILVDCPPNLGLLTLNALTAADLVIVPVQTEYLAMRSIKELISIIDKVKERTNPELSMKLLCTMFDRRTIHGRDVINELREVFGHQVFDTVITRTIKFADASVAAEPILSYAPLSSAAKQYRNLAKEVISYVQERKS
jgi:chromosome partitioning protein